MKTYKDQVSEAAAKKFLEEASPSLNDELCKKLLRSSVCGAMNQFASELLPIIEEKEKEAVKAKGELALLLRELKDTDSEQKDAIGFKTWCDELHEQYYDAGIKEEFWKLTDSTLEPLDYSDKELYELHLKQKA